MSKVFKKSVFGGFKKSDVIAYLGTLAEEKTAERERADGEVMRLEKTITELKQKLTLSEESDENLRAALAAQKAETETVSCRRTQAEEAKAQLQKEKEHLESKLAMLERETIDFQARMKEDKAQLQSRVNSELEKLEQERRLMLSEKSELERRVIDLETEIVQIMEKRGISAAVSGAERARMGAREVYRSLAEVEPVENKVLLEDLKRELEQIIGEINRLILISRDQEEARQGEREAIQNASGRLGTIKDILQYVKRK